MDEMMRTDNDPIGNPSPVRPIPPVGEAIQIKSKPIPLPPTLNPHITTAKTHQIPTPCTVDVNRQPPLVAGTEAFEQLGGTFTGLVFDETFHLKGQSKVASEERPSIDTVLPTSMAWMTTKRGIPPYDHQPGTTPHNPN